MAAGNHNSKQKLVLNLVAGAILLIALTGFFVFAFARLRYNWEWDRLWEYRVGVFKGWGLTVVISVCALVLSVVLAFVLVIAQRSGIAVVRVASRTPVTLPPGSHTVNLRACTTSLCSDEFDTPVTFDVSPPPQVDRTTVQLIDTPQDQ